MNCKELFSVLLLIVFLWKMCAGSSQCPEVASSIGSEFVFGIPSVAGNAASTSVYVHITPLLVTVARVRITAPYINFDKSFTIQNYTRLVLNNSLIQTEQGRHFKGIEVLSDVNISVSIFVGYPHNTEGFLALPVSALSTRYVAASYRPYASNSELLIAGVYSDTDIRVKYPDGIKSVNTTLRKFETYQIFSSDVSGAVVTSNKPVAVISGAGYSQIPYGTGDYNYIVEQMIPTKYWTNKYIVPPIYPHNYFLVRIFAKENNTEIHYYNSTKHYADFVDEGTYMDAVFGSEPVVILSNKPLSVMQYCLDTENINGNPFMTTVQGVSQYSDTYKIAVEQIVSGTNTIAITVQTNDTKRLLFNGNSIENVAKKTFSVTHPMEDYTVIFINVSDSIFVDLRQQDGMAFGASIYGLISIDYYSYGYPLQLLLSTPECETGHVTSTPSGIQSTHTSGGVQSHQEYLAGNGTWCFQCDDMSHLRYCDRVTRCQTKDEVCAVQSYTRSHNVVLYRSGCMKKNTCESRDDQVDCQQCCNGNFCNVAGCGDDGLPDFHSRGPFCFDCGHQGEHEFCQTVQMCRPGQVCKIEKYEWGSEHHYILGCANNQVCSSKREVHTLDTRHVPVCSRCCHSDFCNMNCTGQHTPDII
ncbi:IgGFc-binding protein-like, partial [Mercenaria mercenaria]|uniref:IgGFc-binding protein-like n=1 Tax=Mercenaria mercenaria TaxID=6596 RepID=UPI00234ECD61